MYITNAGELISSGYVAGRRKMLQILEAGLSAADPYPTAARLLRRKNNMLYVGNPDFEAANDPNSGVEQYDLDKISRIFVVGAGKGVQRAAKAFEDVLGDRLTGGELICKYGDETILTRINVTHGAHPVPDENCVLGAKRIVELAREISENDLVVTIIANGGSALLTLPFGDIPLEDAQRVVRLMQIEKGACTTDLNMVRNHIDHLKGGRLSRLFAPAKMIHIVVADANHHTMEDTPTDYDFLMRHNMWLHNLPEGSTFADAADALRRHGAWDECPESIRRCLLTADPAKETVKYEEFRKMRFRVFGIMPRKYHFIDAARRKAEELGYRTAILSESVHCEAAQAGYLMGAIACNIERRGEPLEPPVALFSTGEMRVTVGKMRGTGGRNQEYAVAAATVISGCKRVVMASVDTDGTDGPGGLKLAGAPACLAGGIVDGLTLSQADELGVDLAAVLREHDLSPALWLTGCGVTTAQGVSLNDFTVTLIDRE